jgi:hypothetical protein
MVALVTIIQAALEWAVFSAGLFGEDPAAAALLRPLTVAWFIAIAALVVAAVQQDPIPGADQDWLIRPINRTHLLLAKLLFLTVTISVPMFAANFLDALASGFALAPSFQAVLMKELFVLACFVVPVMALAAATRNMSEFVILSAALVVAFALSVTLSAFFLGANWCPTCNSGVSWLQHIVQHCGILLGAAAILALQYYRRRSNAARALAIAGAVALVIAQLPWSAAFSMQHWITRPNGAAGVVSVELGEAPRDDSGMGGGFLGELGAGARQATATPSHGRIGQTLEYWRRRVRPSDGPLSIDLPVRVSGVADDELLLADRTAVRLFDEGGRLLYRGDNTGGFAQMLTPRSDRSSASSAVTHQTLEIPGGGYRKAAAAAARLQINYSLSLMKLVGEYKLAALDGELHSNDTGICATLADRNAIYLRCKTIDQTPFCYSASLYSGGAVHNSEVLRCIPDYRRHLPPLMEVMGMYGADLPLRDKNGNSIYDLSPADLRAAVVVVRVYGELAHFRRSVTSSRTPSR